MQRTIAALAYPSRPFLMTRDVGPAIACAVMVSVCPGIQCCFAAEVALALYGDLGDPTQAHRLGLSAAAWILEQSGMVSADPVTIAGPDPASCLAALQSSLQGLQRINVLLVSAVLEVTPGPLDAAFCRAGARSTVEVLQVWIASPMNRLKIIDPRT